jgi:hypothetical protein
MDLVFSALLTLWTEKGFNMRGLQQKEINMNIQRLQGPALIVSAVCLLLGLFGPQTIGIVGPQTAMLYVTTSAILFILGIPAIHLAQPTGWIGLAGIVLLELAALIVLGFRFNMMPSGLADSLSLTSAIAGTLGAVITGWLTTREHVFPAWVGWAFMAQGLLTFLSGQLTLNSLPAVLLMFFPILQAMALFGYGYFIFQPSIKPTIASESKAPLA